MATVVHSHVNEVYSHVIKFDASDLTPLPGGKGEDAYFELPEFLPKEWVLKDIAVKTWRPFSKASGSGSIGIRVGVNVAEDAANVDNWFTKDDLWVYGWPKLRLEQIGGVPTTTAGASGNNGGIVRLTFHVSPSSGVSDFVNGTGAVLLNIIDVGEIAKGIWP